MDWFFKIDNSGNCFSTPSFTNYQVFLKRVKYIINNSNYGAEIKASKLYPIIREWRIYHKFSRMTSSKFSLFFIQKRAFKIFNKESKQDAYSTKKLLKKCFSFTNFNSLSEDKIVSPLPYYGHVTFWIDFLDFYNTTYIEKHFKRYSDHYFCIFCGTKIIDTVLS